MVHRCPNCDAQCGCEEYKQLGYCAHECPDPIEADYDDPPFEMIHGKDDPDMTEECEDEE